MSRPPHSTLQRVLAVAALWVLVMGLPQMLVICTGADGIGKLEFAHTPGACCDDAEPILLAAACCTDHEDGTARLLPDRRCEHVGFAIELAPPQSVTATGVENPPAIGWVHQTEVVPDVRCTVSSHPPSTGPPRPDQAISLRATTLLLL